MQIKKIPRSDESREVVRLLTNSILPRSLHKNIFLTRLASRLVRFMFIPVDFSRLFDEDCNLGTVDFYSRAFEKINFTYKWTTPPTQYIPQSGPVIFIANHTLGPADLFIAILLSRFRPDIKIITNEYLYRVDTGFKDIFLPVPTRSKYALQFHLRLLKRMQDGGSLLIFPAGKVANRYRDNLLQDEIWSGFFCRLASETGATIVPIRTNGSHNKWLYHFSHMGNWAMYIFQMSGLRLMFRMKNRHVNASVGPPITASELKHLGVNFEQKCAAVRKRLEQIIVN